MVIARFFSSSSPLRLGVGVLVVCVLMPFLSCKEEVDPYLTSDELVRLEAFQNVHYPEAVRMKHGMFYHVASGALNADEVKEGHWLVFDFSVYDLEGLLINTSSKEVARDNGVQKDRAYLRPRVQRNIAPEWGATLCEVLSSLHVGDSVVIGVPYSLGSRLKLWTQPKHQSVILHLKVRHSFKNEKQYENACIRAYLDQNDGFRAYDTVYRRVLFEGDGDFIKDEYSVLLNYSGYFLDGVLFDTNIQSVAIDQRVFTVDNDYRPMLVKATKDPKAIRGFSRAFVGLKQGCHIQLIVPSEVAYKGRGRGAIQPHEPLLFDLHVEGVLK